MPEVETTAGTIKYEDTGGEGQPVVLLHGVLMDAEQWREVVPGLSADYRVIRPTLPLGAHPHPMQPDADLSLRGQVKLVAELLELLDLRQATLAFNDWAAPQLLIADGLADRVGSLILVACETAGNYPPGLPGRNLALMGRVPGALSLGLRAMGFRPVRRLPIAFGWMSKRGIPDELVDQWLDRAPARSPRARRTPAPVRPRRGPEHRPRPGALPGCTPDPASTGSGSSRPPRDLAPPAAGRALCREHLSRPPRRPSCRLLTSRLPSQTN